MIALLQRVSRASVEVDQQVIARIDRGVLALIGVQPDDNQQKADKLLYKLLNYRIFEDNNECMNLSLQDIAGDLLLVPQFTLAADTRKGLRPGFSTAASPDAGQYWFNQLVTAAKAAHNSVQTGQFGADMQVSLVNSGPATFWLQT